MSEQLETETGLKVIVPTIHRGIERLGLTRKKTFHDPKQESEEVKEQKKNYQLAFGEIATKNLVFGDETGIWLNFTRTHGRSEQGKRCHGQRPKPKGKIVTLIGAICMSGVIASLMFAGGTNTETFLFFVREILVPTL